MMLLLLQVCGKYVCTYLIELKLFFLCPYSFTLCMFPVLFLLVMIMTGSFVLAYRIPVDESMLIVI